MSNELFPEIQPSVPIVGSSQSENELSAEEIRETNIAKFRALHTREDIAALLGLSDQGLRFQLYGRGKRQRYNQFLIPKKSGGARKILAPNEPWKKVQRRLLEYLELFYEPRSSAHGFINERSVLTNAKAHVRKRWVLNLDLKDFFREITFPRVFGLFSKSPFNCSREVATVLAQIVIHDGELPQGAPTSPLISNMIAARLDSRLNKLAKKFRCRYTRYSDDITFSTNSQDFPTEIAEVTADLSKTECRLSHRLVRLIEENGFHINEEKVRVRTPRQRQEVTGVIVNRRINVPREFIREIRAILSDCKRRGWENAAQRFAMKTRIMPGKTLTPDRFKHIVRGKIEYIGAVRGRTDMIYLRYLAEFARLAPEFASEKTLSWLREQDKYQSVLDKLVIVEVDYPSGLIPNGGTAFFLKDVGLVT